MTLNIKVYLGMNISDLLIPEIENEANITRAFLAHLPEDKWDWQPHEKSMPLDKLANHVVELFEWIPATMDEDVLQLNDYQFPTRDKAALLEALEHNLPLALESLRKDNVVYDELWTMKQGDTIFMQMSRYTTLRSMVIPQIPHHRAQLGLYFRLLDIPVPASYGDSADSNQA